MDIYKSKQGFSLVELLVAISFLGVMIVLIVGVSYHNDKLRRVSEERTQAMLFAIESVEAVKLLDWADLAAGDYHTELSGNAWTLVSGSELINGQFTKTVTISDVYRTSSSNNHAYGDIVTSGGYLDPDSKLITVTIDWVSKSGADQQEVLQNYIHRWSAYRSDQTDWVGGDGQDIFTDDTQFFSKSAGVDITIAGLVTLLSGFLDWNEATTTATYSVSGAYTVNGIDLMGGYIYLVTNNNSSGDELHVFDVSDIYSPALRDGLSTGGLSDIKVKGDYAYLAGKNNSNELRIVDIADPYNISTEGSYNLDGNKNARDVAIDETEAYIIRDDMLYSFSVVDPSDPQLLDEIAIDDDAEKMFLSEDAIYVAVDDSDRELQIFNITNPANLDTFGYYDLPGSLVGTDVFVQGNNAYISTENNTAGEEFYIFDISDPSDPLYLGDYEAGTTIHSITIIGPYALLGTNSNTEELVVLDVSFPATINKVSGFDLEGYIYSMVANCSNVYAGTSNSSEELLIFSTEEQSCGYADSGTLESSTFDAGSDQVVYNWIAWSGSEPANTDISFQIATSNNINGPWNFVGPDGTAVTYFSTAAYELINYDHHLDQRYFRYKLFLDNQAELQAPILEEIIISYSTYP